MKPPLVLTVLVLVVGASVCAADPSITCATCHLEQAALIGKSVHADLSCQPCHGGPGSYDLSTEDLERARLPGGTFDHGDGYWGKTARRDVPQRCGTCHADVERMNPYGLRTDQLERYKTSGHGKTLFDKGDDRVAVCIDCHGSHNVFGPHNPQSATHPANVPDLCGRCHENIALMGEYDLAVEVVEEYRQSVHGRLLLEEGDTGAPTCATCHGNHSAIPPGYAVVGEVCGKCHQTASDLYKGTIHAEQEDFKGCVQCHGGGEDGHLHLIERITQPAGIMARRYDRLLEATPLPTPEQITAVLHPEPRRIMDQALSGCLECHDEPDEDEGLAKIFGYLDEIADAERTYVATARRLDEMGQGIVLVDNQRFLFEDAKTHLIALAAVQHGLDDAKLTEKLEQLKSVCTTVDAQLADLDQRLTMRHRLLAPIWIFVVALALVLYVKFKQLKTRHVRPVDADGAVTGAAAGAADLGPTRRSVLDLLIGMGSAVLGAALAIPMLLYLWPAAKGGGAANVEVEGADALEPGGSIIMQVAGKPVIVVRDRKGFKAFSAVCTHLGCLVTWEAGAKEFRCPCHAAAFDANGQVVSGPPPTALPQYEVKEFGSQVFVSTS